MSTCRICSSPIEPFIDFGRMPLANGFLTPAQFAGEYFFNLSAAFCPHCTLVQLVEQPARERMFNERYPFFSASSARMSAHFANLANDVIEHQLPAGDPLIAEIGSNDGTLLRHAAARGIRHVGIEPSASVARAATANGVNTICQFFDPEVAKTIVTEHGQADVVIAANALSHMADPHAIVDGIDLLLRRDGVVVVEDPYWGDVVSQTAFDQIYDEHASYFTLSSLQYLVERHGFAVVDVVRFDVHGGSMRYILARTGSRRPADRVAALLEAEAAAGLLRRDYLAKFRERVMATGADLIALLRRCNREGRRVVGYGATSKSTTTINFFGITPELIEFISDTTPAKQGTFSPGMHIPVKAHAEFAARYPERALLFSWNHAAEVKDKEPAFTAGGGRWISYVPAVHES
jgi:methylation protein EvaC